MEGRGNRITVGDLSFSALIEPNVKEGRLKFNQRRAIILDVGAMGALRQQLIETLGVDLTMGVLSRFGYSHGYTDATMLGQSFEWATETDWLAAGPFIHTLEGIVHVTPMKIEFDRQSGDFHMHGIWRNSFEAEEHVRRFGTTDRPVCWTLTGYASGYATAFFGHDLLAIETECVGKGDERCYWEIRPAERWDERAEPYVRALEAVHLPGQIADAHRQLRQSEDRFRDIAMTSEDWFWEVDTSGRCIYSSDGVARMLGYLPQELIGKTPCDLMAEDEAEGLRTVLTNIVSERRQVIDLESRLTAKNGRTVVVLSNGVPFTDAAGNLQGYRGVSRDITKHRQADEALRMQHEYLKAIEDLRGAFAKVKTLSGLFPICAHCKKIRDEVGRWNQIEVYIRERSEAEFTHSICPDCLKKHYPAYAIDK